MEVVMQVADLSQEVREQIARYHLDLFLEKHEGYGWRTLINHARFIEVGSLHILLPFKDDDEQVSVLRRLGDERGDLLMLFLRFEPTESIAPAAIDPFENGDVLAVCVRVPEQDFFITIVYHEVFRLD